MNHKKNWLIISISLIFIIFFSITTIPKPKIRKLIDTNAESLIRCSDGPNYLISYYTKGGNQTFDTFINRDYVRPLIEIEKGGKKSDYIGYYIERLAINFIYFSIAILIIIFWIIFSFCLCNPKFCFIEKKGEKNITLIAFIISIACFLGCFCCSISAFVYSHEYENYLDGALCGIERIYYDIKDGQVKENGDNWLGLSKSSNVLEQIYNLNLPPYNYENFDFDIGEDDSIGNYNFNEKIKEINIIGGEIGKKYTSLIRTEIKDKLNNYIEINKNLTKSLEELINEKDNLEIAKNSLNDVEKNIVSYYNNIMIDYEDYRKVFKGIGYYFNLAFYSIVLVVSFGCTLFLFLYYFCASYKFFLLIIQIFWHILIFLSIILFILVGVFGIISMLVNDGIAYIKYVFGKENIKKEKIVIWKYYDFINSCLYNNKSLIWNYGIENYNLSYTNYKLLSISKNIIYQTNISNIETAKSEIKDPSLREKFEELEKIFKEMTEEMYKKIDNMEQSLDSIYSSVQSSLSLKKNSLNLFYFMDCSFLKYDLEMSYIISYDFQDKVNSLFIITICAAFFSIIGVFFMLMTILRRKGANYNDYDDNDNNSENSSENLNKKSKDLLIENGNKKIDKDQE